MGIPRDPGSNPGGAIMWHDRKFNLLLKILRKRKVISVEDSVALCITHSLSKNLEEIKIVKNLTYLVLFHPQKSVKNSAIKMICNRKFYDKIMNDYTENISPFIKKASLYYLFRHYLHTRFKKCIT